MDPHAIITNMIEAWESTPNDWKFWCAIASVVITAPVYRIYYNAVLHAPKTPTMSSWISWLLMDSTILAGMLENNVVFPQMVIYTIGTAYVVWACLKRGATLGWTSIDSISIGLVIVAIGYWWYTADPFVAIIFPSVGCAIGATPMMINLYRDPLREPITPWMMVSVASIFAVVALRKWDLESWFTAVFFLGIQLFALGLAARRYRVASVR